jgi:uncharacterized protein YybS (DUF2232 family)
MDYVVYFFLDCFDTLAIFFLMMAVFQYPIREYLADAAIMASILALSSLIARNVFGIAAIYDLSIHIGLLIYGLRFLMKVRLHRGTRMVGVGAIGYFALQTIVVTLTTKAGVIDPHSLDIPNSWDSRSIQLLTQSLAYIISYLIVVFDLGITKFVRPPHDFYVDKQMTKEKKNVICVSVSTLLGLSVAFYVYIEKLDIIGAFVLANILFIIVILFTYRRDNK